MTCAATDRLYPKRESTPELRLLLARGAVRRCHSVHECCLCDEPIKDGQFYLDKGLKLRAHVRCVHPKRECA